MDDFNALTFGLSPELSVDWTLSRLFFTELSAAWMLLLPPASVDGFERFEIDDFSVLTDWHKGLAAPVVDDVDIDVELDDEGEVDEGELPEVDFELDPQPANVNAAIIAPEIPRRIPRRDTVMFFAPCSCCGTPASSATGRGVWYQCRFGRGSGNA